MFSEDNTWHFDTTGWHFSAILWVLLVPSIVGRVYLLRHEIGFGCFKLYFCDVLFLQDTDVDVEYAQLKGINIGILSVIEDDVARADSSASVRCLCHFGGANCPWWCPRPSDCHGLALWTALCVEREISWEPQIYFRNPPEGIHASGHKPFCKSPLLQKQNAEVLRKRCACVPVVESKPNMF